MRIDDDFSNSLSDPSRREFLSYLGLAGAVALVGGQSARGEISVADSFAKLISPDKHLDPAWVRSLFERGVPTVYAKSRDELQYIGMPVGGFCCGTLYLAGDGRLWNWDIFNENQEGVLPHGAPASKSGFSFAKSGAVWPRNGANYIDPRTPDLPGARRVEQGFSLRASQGGKQLRRALQASDWPEVEFAGTYPIGTVTYRDAAFPLSARLEAFSPFIPLDTDESSLPITILNWTITNTGAEPVEAALSGWLENACSLLKARPSMGTRVNTVSRGERATLIESRFQRGRPAPAAADRPDIVLADFESGTYEQLGWQTTGDAFGKEPIARKDLPAYQGDVRGEGERVVNSHASAAGSGVNEKDARTGTLVGPQFRIERKFIAFWIGGGANAKEVGIRLLVDGKEVRRAAGNNQNAMGHNAFDVAEFQGKQANLEIFDHGKAGWGNIGVDQIVQTDSPQIDFDLEKHGDWGTMALAVLNPAAGAVAQLDDDRAAGGKCVGELTDTFQLAPGESKTVSFLVAWYFPNQQLNIDDGRAYYSRKFASAGEVAGYAIENFERLAAQTRLWRDTWYDSTLPYWFLDRAMANTSTLATTTCHRFTSGRFWAWEGIGCCAGTCTHVWHYAQAVGRLFPEIERDQRERVDFGVALNASTGMIGHRGEHTGPAEDGQAGRILGVYREHTMSEDGDFLKRIWPQVRKATEYLLNNDPNADGILDGAQHNTLDAAWYGEIAWISGLALAAYQAAATMADEVGDSAFASTCRQRIAAGKQAIDTRLWNGEYFIQRAVQGKEKTLGTYDCCHIDQVLGEAWLRQLSLPPVLDPKLVRTALASLYRYNFTPDVGPFREVHTGGRPYAIPGDGGLLMTTNPQGRQNPFGGGGWQVGYFNECMSGFEHQVIWHMLSEGLTTEALVCFRAIHDRYHGRLRNPYNEVECSDHYARAMASYGVFIAACGFECHGPKRHIGFAPRLRPEQFRAPFTAAEGWGTVSQTRAGGEQVETLVVKHGQLQVESLAFELAEGAQAKSVSVTLGQQAMKCSFKADGKRLLVQLPDPVTLQPEQELRVTIHTA